MDRTSRQWLASPPVRSLNYRDQNIPLLG